VTKKKSGEGRREGSRSRHSEASRQVGRSGTPREEGDKREGRRNNSADRAKKIGERTNQPLRSQSVRANCVRLNSRREKCQVRSVKDTISGPHVTTSTRPRCPIRARLLDKRPDRCSFTLVAMVCIIRTTLPRNTSLKALKRFIYLSAAIGLLNEVDLPSTCRPLSLSLLVKVDKFMECEPSTVLMALRCHKYQWTLIRLADVSHAKG